MVLGTPTGWGSLILLCKLDALLDGGLQLRLELFQALFLVIRQGTKSEYFLQSILSEPYLHERHRETICHTQRKVLAK